MLKQQEKRRVLKPFILAYEGEEAARSGKTVLPKNSQQRVQNLKVINRLMERVKRI